MTKGTRVQATVHCLRRDRLHAWLEMSIPPFGQAPEPGQYLLVRPPGDLSESRILSRPFSISSYREEEGRAYVAIMLKAVGPTTRSLQALVPGAELTITGPMGQGFEHPDAGRPVLLVAGGIGVAAMPAIACALRAHDHDVMLLLGARESEQLPLAGPHSSFQDGFAMQQTSFLPELFLETGCRVRMITDNGDLPDARGGTVVDLLEEELSGASQLPAVYACGPIPMLAAVGKVLERTGATGWALMEEIFGCGAGVCRSCVCWGTDADGHERLLTVCREGPVMPFSRLNLEKDRGWSQEAAHAPAPKAPVKRKRRAKKKA